MMTEPKIPIEQKSPRDAIRAIARSPFRLSVSSCVLAAIALLLPFIGVRIDIGFVDQRIWLNGFDAAGWVAIVTLSLFVSATAARRLEQIASYRSVLEMAAVAGAAITILVAWFYNPAADLIEPFMLLERQFTPAGESSQQMVRQYPHIGTVVLVAASNLVMLARRRDRNVSADR
ncbi:hypothetical protein [Sphingomonas sp. OV641]|jgi:hypothetical protein